MQRMTLQRTYILEALSVLGHASLNEIKDYLKVNLKKSSLASIYRNLEVLESDNLIKSLDISNDSKIYELSNQAAHDHFICNSCHSLIDVEIIHSNKENIKEIEGNKVEKIVKIYYGICSRCLK